MDSTNDKFGTCMGTLFIGFILGVSFALAVANSFRDSLYDVVVTAVNENHADIEAEDGTKIKSVHVGLNSGVFVGSNHCARVQYNRGFPYNVDLGPVGVKCK